VLGAAGDGLAFPRSRFGLSKKSCMACSRLLSVKRRYCAARSGSAEVIAVKSAMLSSILDRYSRVEGVVWCSWYRKRRLSDSSWKMEVVTESLLTRFLR